MAHPGPDILHPHPTDARCRCLTPDQIHYLATIHQRPLAEDVPLPEACPTSDPHLAHRDDAPSSSSISELRDQVSQLQTTLITLQQQLTQLTLDHLNTAMSRAELVLPSLPPPLPQPPTLEKTTGLPSSQKPPHSRKGQPRALIPLIEYVAPGSYVIISPQLGQLHLKPESREWFAWLDTLTSFRFLGKQGRLSTNRKNGRSSWMAYRRSDGHCSTFSLGPTEQITLARLEHMASILQSVGASPTS